MAGFSKRPYQKIFKKLGDDVSFVTHCGLSYWKVLGSGSRVDSKEGRELATYRHQSEALWYDILNHVKMPTMKIRKVKVDYFDVNSNEKISSNIGFFRESPSRVAKRCDLVTFNSAIETNFELEEKELNKTIGKLLHEIVTSTDYIIDLNHNTKQLFQIDNRAKKAYAVYVPYDFDLSALIVPGYKPGWFLTTKALKIKWLVTVSYTHLTLPTICSV